MTAYSAIANSEIAVGAPITNSLMTKVRDNPLAIQEDDASAPEVAYATTSGAVTGQGALATLATVSQSEIDAAAVGQGELITSTVENSYLRVGSGADFTLDATTSSAEYPLGGAAKSSDAARSSNFRVTGNMGGAITDSTSYVSGAGLWTLTYDTSDSVTVYIRGRYITASPPYIYEDRLMSLFIYCKYVDNIIIQVHVCEDPPWRQVNYQKLNGKKLISNFNNSSKKLEQRDFVMGDKFTHMNETPHPFGDIAVNEEVVMCDPYSDITKELLTIHKSGESVAELIHDGEILIGNKTTPFAGVDVVDIEWA